MGTIWNTDSLEIYKYNKYHKCVCCNKNTSQEKYLTPHGIICSLCQYAMCYECYMDNEYLINYKEQVSKKTESLCFNAKPIINIDYTFRMLKVLIIMKMNKIQ